MQSNVRVGKCRHVLVVLEQHGNFTLHMIPCHLHKEKRRTRSNFRNNVTLTLQLHYYKVDNCNMKAYYVMNMIQVGLARRLVYKQLPLQQMFCSDVTYSNNLF